MRGRNETAAVCEQYDQRDLAHVSGFAAHVRAGDQQHAARRRQLYVVADEAADLSLDDRVTPLTNIYDRFIYQLRRTIVVARGGLRECVEAIEQGHCVSDALQGRDLR